MKIHISTSALLAIAFQFEFSEGAASINYGTYTQDWEEPCLDVIAANDFYGGCCSFSDIDENGKKCRLTVAGQNGGCGWTNKQYMKDCEAQNKGCLAGPYVSVFYDDDMPVEECPDSWLGIPITYPPTEGPTASSTTSPDYDVTYAVTEEACPFGSITAFVRDNQGQPVAGTSVGFLLVGESSYDDSVITDVNGYATFEFTASHLDAGATLWCSMAVENPNYGPSNFQQQVPCSISVCDKCVPTNSPFDGGYGSCETYAQGDKNSNYCNEDFDSHEGLYADEACAECGKCIAEPSATNTCPTYKPKNGEDCDWEVLGGCGYDCCCDSDKIGTCASEKRCWDGSIFETKARIIGCSNFGCDAQGNPLVVG